jgi:hypothetical protein
MDDLDNNLRKKPLGVRVIAAWLLLSTGPGVWWSLPLGRDIILSRVAVVVWAYNTVALLCALGLFFWREWARKGAVWLFSVYFIWAVVAVHLFLGPALWPLSLWLAGSLSLSQTAVEKGLFVLCVFYILWPVLAVFYLTYPGVKISFIDRKTTKASGRGTSR